MPSTIIIYPVNNKQRAGRACERATARPIRGRICITLGSVKLTHASRVSRGGKDGSLTQLSPTEGGVSALALSSIWRGQRLVWNATRATRHGRLRGPTFFRERFVTRLVPENHHSSAVPPMLSAHAILRPRTGDGVTSPPAADGTPRTSNSEQDHFRRAPLVNVICW